MCNMQQVDLRRAGKLGRPAEPAPLLVKPLLQLRSAALDRLGGLAGFKRLPHSCTVTLQTSAYPRHVQHVQFSQGLGTRAPRQTHPAWSEACSSSWPVQMLMARLAS